MTMSKLRKVQRNTPEYPEIYTYIYERELEDTQRVVRAHKTKDLHEAPKNIVGKKVASIKIVNGVPIAVLTTGEKVSFQDDRAIVIDHIKPQSNKVVIRRTKRNKK